jgi:hypothetical protein
MNKLKKIIFVAFGILTASGLSLVALFLVVNLCPRAMPDELWITEYPYQAMFKRKLTQEQKVTSTGSKTL